MSYKQFWWVNFFSAVAIVYLGVRAYFTNIRKLQELTFDIDQTSQRLEIPLENLPDYSKQKEKIIRFIEDEKAFLDPNLTLKDLSRERV